MDLQDLMPASGGVGEQLTANYNSDSDLFYHRRLGRCIRKDRIGSTRKIPMNSCFSHLSEAPRCALGSTRSSGDHRRQIAYYQEFAIYTITDVGYKYPPTYSLLIRSSLNPVRGIFRCVSG